ncbi:MAG: NAD-dependent succinate-semialdehyde dehydrogenase [Micavibrio sp.]
MAMNTPVPSLIETKAFIGGKWTDAKSGAVFAVTNPADGSKIAAVPDMDGADAALAIDAAARAFEPWSGMTPLARGDILIEWGRLIAEQADALALLMTCEQGKPLAEARGEILAAAGTLRWCAEEGRRLYGDFIEGAKKGTKILVSRHPAGVAAAITPWNFPVGMITRKVGPALAAGCTVVLKPAEATPLCALALARLAEQAGMPAGALNIVTSQKAAEIGKVFTADPRVAKISFTGSTRVGKILMAQAAANIQKISLELGGNAPCIVLPSADLEKAADGAIASKFRNAGQTCICANRIFVHKDVYQPFRKIFNHKLKGLIVGPGWEENVSIGPLINKQAIEKIEKMISSAAPSGAEIITGGNPHPLGGTFFEPTLIEGADDSAALFTEEIFGPVAVLYEFSDEDALVRRANATPYGLAAYLYSQDMAQIWRLSDALQYGMVGVNEPLLANDLAPFGGIKTSGIGKEGGKYGLLEFTNMKYRLFG